MCKGTSLPRIPEFDRGELVSLDGAAMLLAWFGLAKPVRGSEEETQMGCNVSLRSPRDFKEMVSREDPAIKPPNQTNVDRRLAGSHTRH